MVAQLQEGTGTAQQFDLPAGSLTQSLNAVSRQLGVTLAVDPSLVAGRTAPALHGNYTPAQALNALLAGGDLQARIAADGSVTIERASTTQDGGLLRLAPITITSEKTTRSYKDTATSIAVFSDNDLKRIPGGGTTLRDVYKRVPNMVDTGTGNLGPSVRGSDTTGAAQGFNALTAGTRPRLTVTADGRPLSFQEFAFGRSPLWDIESVEVLRGPQTTLQGRNAIAGAVVINTKDPTFDYEVGGRAIVGNYHTRQFSGVVSGPIVEDQLALRLAADFRNHETFVSVTNQNVGYSDPRRDDSTDIRGKLLFLPDELPELKAKLTFSHTDVRRPQFENVQLPFGDRRNGGTFPGMENRTNSGTLDLSYFLSDSIELRNTATYSRTDFNRLTLTNFGRSDIQIGQLSNETILEYDPVDGPFRAVVGTYFFDADQVENNDSNGGLIFIDKTKTAALFGEGTYTFLEKLDLTLGGRLESENRKRFGGTTNGATNVDLDETFSAFLPKAGVAYHFSDALTIGATVQRGSNSGGASLNFANRTEIFVYDEEYVWNYEAYFRSTALDDRLAINGNFFFADYEDQQRFSLTDPNDPLSGVIFNAEEAYSYGAEMNATWLPVDKLEIYGALGLLKTKLVEFSASGEDFAGNEFARAPLVTASFGAVYRPFKGFSIGFDGRYSDDYFSDDDNDPTAVVDAFTVFNAQADYTHENYRFFGYVNNIFDTDAELQVFPGTTTFAAINDPLEFGVGMELSF